jgi:hypothetical protein
MWGGRAAMRCGMTRLRAKWLLIDHQRMDFELRKV